jgi:pseudouridine-5'-phosphate glycosidase/pseudouridine kinase
MRSLDVQQPGANLFAVPIPEKYEAAGEAIARAVEQAVAESVANGMAKRGKEVTPWLLKRVGELSTSSKESNVALVVNNARVAAETAVELQWLRGSKDAKSGRTWSSRRGENGLVFGKPGMPLVRAAGDPDALLSPAQRAVKFERELDARMALGKLEQAAAFGDEIDEETQRNAEKLQQLAEQAAANNYEEPGPQEILVFGGAALDFTTRAHPDETDTRDAIEPSLRETPLGAGPILGDTLPGRMWVNAGGVARNVAEAASRLSASPDAVQLIAPIAEDQQGEMLESALEDAEMRTDGLFVAPGASTATATMMLSSDGSLLRGIIDMDITEQHILPATVSEALALRSQEESHLVAALDCNVSVPTLRAAFSYMTGERQAA